MVRVLCPASRVRKERTFEMSARDLTDYEPELDEPRPEGTPSESGLRMAALLRGEEKQS